MKRQFLALAFLTGVAFSGVANAGLQGNAVGVSLLNGNIQLLGWVCDPDKPQQQYYVTPQALGMALGQSKLANLTSVTGQPYNCPGAHGFKIVLTPTQVSAAQGGQIWIYTVINGSVINFFALNQIPY